MKVLDAGHQYEFSSFDGGEPQVLTFVKRNDPADKYPGNEDAYPGTQMQEVLRALIERCQYLEGQIPCPETRGVIENCRDSIWLLESRHARRHNGELTMGRDAIEQKPPALPVAMLLVSVNPLISQGARFSDDRVYRYSLWRCWNPSQPYVMFVGLNPSTADEKDDDPTIRRCIGFCKSWGFGGLYMLNLFALRSTDPKLLKSHTDPVGADNNRALSMYAEASAWVIAAWGTHGALLGRGQEVIDVRPAQAGGPWPISLAKTSNVTARSSMSAKAAGCLLGYRPSSARRAWPQCMRRAGAESRPKHIGGT